MIRSLAAMGTDETLRLGLLVTAFTIGLRHGADWDHIAAIADIAGAHKDRRRSMVLAGIYAGGHALAVLVLGLIAIFFGRLLPASFDEVMSKVVGVTLLVLGVYLLTSLVRQGRSFRFRSRWSAVLDLASRLRARFSKTRYETVVVEHSHPHEHDSGHTHDHDHSDRDVGHRAEESPIATATAHAHTHAHSATVPVTTGYTRRTTMLIGVLHGVGAETPTQVLLFLTAAGVAGHVAGVAVLLAFIAGLLLTNTLIAAAATYGFLEAGRNFPVYAGIAVITALFSLALGASLLFGLTL